MRKSMNISDGTKKMISQIKTIKYPNARVTDSYIINESVKYCGIDILERLLSSTTNNNQYGSTKYTLDITANEIIEYLMSKGYTADSIVNESLKQMEHLEMYKRRARIIKNKSMINIIGTNSTKICMLDYLPLIYSISISNGKECVVLYVGKTKLFASRVSNHLSSIIDDPSYLGLIEDDLFNNELSLILNIEEEIDILNCDNMIQFEKLLTSKETEIIEKLNPITQCGKNMIKNQELKRKQVKMAINNLLNRN